MPSRASWTFQDYSKEKSTMLIDVIPIDAASITTVTNHLALLTIRIMGVQQANCLMSNRIIAVDAVSSRAAPSDKACQREVKWVVQWEDTVLHTLGRNEIPCAKLDLVTANSDYMDLLNGEGAVLKLAWENVFRSPAGNPVVVRSVKLAGRRG